MRQAELMCGNVKIEDLQSFQAAEAGEGYNL